MNPSNSSNETSTAIPSGTTTTITPSGTSTHGSGSSSMGSTGDMGSTTSMGSTSSMSNTGSTSSTGSDKLITGLFPDRQSAEAAFSSAQSRGYTKDDVNLVMSDDTRTRHFSGDSGTQTELGSKAAEGAGIGGAIGGTVGAVLAGIAAIGTSLVIPGLGLIVAGPLAAAVAGAGAGAAGGGLLGALVGWGIPEERVKGYEEGIKNGGILMGVRAKNDEDAQHFESQWNQQNGQRLSS
jgi:hypothetical protein